MRPRWTRAGAACEVPWRETGRANLAMAGLAGGTLGGAPRARPAAFGHTPRPAVLSPLGRVLDFRQRQEDASDRGLGALHVPVRRASLGHHGVDLGHDLR